MTQENKELLLKDLCARLPYGVMLSITHNKYTDETFNARISTIDYCGEIKVRHGFEEYEQAYSLEQIKPYLRPMSSMTGVEILEYLSLKESIVADDDITYYFETYKSIDWLNKNMFDYHELIPMGLANDATGLSIY